MALYAIGDLHLCLGAAKPMDVFGGNWVGYMDALREGLSVIGQQDTTVLLGDLSWALDIDSAKPDFTFINEIPGRKIILKGNHDYWWATIKKTEEFFAKEKIKSISLLYNNSFLADGKAICGCRGWFIDEKVSPKDTDYDKIVAREAGRLELSLKSAEALGDTERIVFLHFPPVFGDFVCEELIDVLKKYGVKRCFYGHIHGKYDMEQTVTYDGIDFTIVSADYLKFRPLKIV
jgi:predicted phosphohydrolase